MADVKISALPAVVTAATTDIFAIVQGGVTYKATLTQVVTAITSTGLTATAGALTVNLSTGVAGGQSVVGGTAASNNLTLSSTTNATKGKILFGTSAYDEVNNRLGIGTASPSSMLHNVSTASSVGATDSPDNILIDRYTGASASSAAFPLSVLRRARGTEASPSAVLNGDNLGIFGWRSYNGSAFTGTRASLVVFASENWTTTANGTEFAFFTTPSGTTSITERLRIFNTGNVFIGALPSDAGFRLDVNGTARIQDDLTISDTKNIVLATTTGTKIGTGNTQKLGFWNAAPIAQPTTAVAAATLVGGGGTTLTDTDTFDGYTLQQVVKALRNAGLLA